MDTFATISPGGIKHARNRTSGMLVDAVAVTSQPGACAGRNLISSRIPKTCRPRLALIKAWRSLTEALKEA
jgi:hypothetical protein